MATPKKSKAPKSTKKPKPPRIIDRDDAPPSKQKPRHGGGTADLGRRHG